MKITGADKLVAAIMAILITAMVFASGTRDNFDIISSSIANMVGIRLMVGSTVRGVVDASKIDYWVDSTPYCNIYGVKDGGVGGALYEHLNSEKSGIGSSTKLRWDGVNYGQLVAAMNYVTNLNMTGRYISIDKNDGKIGLNKLTFYDASDGTVNTNCAMYGKADNTLVIDSAQIDCSGKKIINVGRGTLATD